MAVFVTQGDLDNKYFENIFNAQERRQKPSDVLLSGLSFQVFQRCMLNTV